MMINSAPEHLELWVELEFILITLVSTLDDFAPGVGGGFDWMRYGVRNPGSPAPGVVPRPSGFYPGLGDVTLSGFYGNCYSIHA